MEKFASIITRISLNLTPVLLIALGALGWVLIFYPDALLKAICAGLGFMCLIAAAAICIGLVRAMIRCLPR